MAESEGSTIEPVPYADPDQQRKYQREWRAARRAEWFAGKTCIDCGAGSDLEVDHVDPRDKIDHKVWSWSRVRREAELAKCVVRCTTCHRAKTIRNQEDQPRTRHGEAQMYQRYRCRCSRCRAWKSASDRTYRERKRGESNAHGVAP